MKMIAKIWEEADRRLFELLEYNRDAKKIAFLMESMGKHGWLNAYPMYVIRNGNGKFKIKDGHHRFEVAQRLGLPFKFVIDEDKATIYELDRATNKWDMEDHLTSNYRAGNIEYAKVRKYRDETGIGINQAISMLVGHQAGSSNSNTIFKRGEFVCKNPKNAEFVRDIVLHMKKHGIGWAHHASLVKALSKISFIEDFSPSILKDKIKLYPFLVTKQANLEAYLELIEEIYNHKSRAKVPLKFLADEKARERNFANR